MRELLRPHGIGARVFPIGRLDFHTSGLLLVTNDGEFADGLLHPRHKVPKTYVVKVNGLMEPADLDRWRSGVDLDDGRTQPAEVSLLRHEERRTWFEITIREGRNQQIRRMGEATGFPVMRLARTHVAGISSEGIRPGEWRLLTRDELTTLKKEYGVPRRIPASYSDLPSRYGGGAPGRRKPEGDWGGGAGRGRSGPAGDDEDRPRGDVGGGRGGRSRTTGTGGGIGAKRGESYRRR
jgi:23S rRNA pseudouridine2605 synthase